MLLRMLLTQLIRQTAERRVRRAVDEAVEGVARQREQRDADGAAGRLPSCEVALIYATGLESGGAVDRLVDSTRTRCQSYHEISGQWGDRAVIVAEAGEEAEKVTRATRDVLDLLQPAWVISAGFATSLTADLEKGTVLMADEVVGPGDERLEVGLTLDRSSCTAGGGMRVGRLLTESHVLRSQEERGEAARRSGAVAADTESIWIADCCRQHKTRFLAARIITDNVDDELPAALRNLEAQSTWAGKLGAATGALFHQPSSMKELWKLKKTAYAMSERLAQFLGDLLPQLK